MNILAVRSVFTSTQLYRAKRGASIGRAFDTRSSRRGSHRRHGAVRVRDGRGYSPEDGRARYLRRARDAPPRRPAPERRVFPLIFTHRRRSQRRAGRRATPSRAHAGLRVRRSTISGSSAASSSRASSRTRSSSSSPPRPPRSRSPTSTPSWAQASTPSPQSKVGPTISWPTRA
jgi:hypothetical protein